MNWFAPIFTKLLIFLSMPISIEVMSSEWAGVWVSLVFSLAINVFEWMRAQFTLLSFQPWQICLEIGFVVLYEMLIILSFIRAIALYTSQILSLIWACVLPAVFTLRYSRVHISTSDCSNMSSYFKTPINKTFHIATTLDISDI